MVRNDLVVGSSADDCQQRLVSKLTYQVSSRARLHDWFNRGLENLKTKKNFETPWLCDSPSNFLTLAGKVLQIYR